jgi:anti-anti-sigma factor
VCERVYAASRQDGQQGPLDLVNQLRKPAAAEVGDPPIHDFVMVGLPTPYILRPMLDKELSYAISDGAKEGIVILAVDGPFTLSNMFRLQHELRALKPACLIMDLTAVPYMDSAGLGVIMNYFVSAETAGRKFLLAGVNERLKALFEMTKVDVVLRLCDTVDAAQALA